MDVYGLIGNPLGHSFSKKYFTEKFLREGIDGAVFNLYEMPDLGRFRQFASAEPGLKGLAVTIPHKQKIVAFLDVLDPVAAAVGAVNCIQFIAEKLIGYNTDATGFELSLRPLLKSVHTRALVLGSGGSAKAICFVLSKLGIPFSIVSRSAASPQGYLGYDDLNANVLKSHRLIVNCTPLGMEPLPSTYPPINYSHIGPGHLLYDLVYSPAKTRFLEFGEQQGAAIKNGYEMLMIQAEENWKIWQQR